MIAALRVHLSECMCVLSRVSHVRIITESISLPCVALCYISPCCAARGWVTRSINPGVNTSEESTKNMLMTMTLFKFIYLYFSTVKLFMRSITP